MTDRRRDRSSRWVNRTHNGKFHGGQTVLLSVTQESVSPGMRGSLCLFSLEESVALLYRECICPRKAQRLFTDFTIMCWASLDMFTFLI